MDCYGVERNDMDVYGEESMDLELNGWIWN